MLVTLGMITEKFDGNELSLLINSGVLSLIETILKDLGKHINNSYVTFILYVNFILFELINVISTRSFFLDINNSPPEKEKPNDDVNVIYEDNTKDFSHKIDLNAIAGTNIISLLTIGTRVVRGPDWKWGDQVNLFIFKS